MSSIPRVLSQRGKSSLEIERENFERVQTASVTKAMSTQETPAKEKHVRVALLGTHKEGGAALFWTIVMKQPLQGHPIVCWKFFHVLYKLLREGHPNTMRDSVRYIDFIKDLGKLWGHLKEGYGRLIAGYSRVLVQKLSFHKKYPPIPGNLGASEQQLEAICNNDVNSYYELSVDFMDYMEEILQLQKLVFGSLDMSRSNSMTATGQCRLAPLIQCIQDSACLYDFIVKFLFKLHAMPGRCLPPDMLEGHRHRFNDQFRSLKTFYFNSTTLQYFKHLVQVPQLPDEPPNFLRASDLNSHVTPVVVVPDPPELATPDGEPIDLLVDTSSVASDEPRMEDVHQSQPNGAPSPPMPDERDRFIEQLMREINELKQELSRMKNEKAEDQMVIESLQNRLRELEIELGELKQISEHISEENNALRAALQESDNNTEALDKLSASENIAKANEAKYTKMKEIYTKLRDEHVKLLRTNADANKTLNKEKQERDVAKHELQAAQQELDILKQEKFRIQASLVQNSAESSNRLEEADRYKEELEMQKRELDDKLRSEETHRLTLEASLNQCQLDIKGLRDELDMSSRDKSALEEQLWRQMQDMQRMLLARAVTEGEAIIRDTLDQFDNPHHSTVTCTTEYLLSRAEPVLQSLKDLTKSCGSYKDNGSASAVGDVIQHVSDFAHKISDTILQGKATANATSDIEKGEELSTICRNSGEESLRLLGQIKEDCHGDVAGHAGKVEDLIQRLLSHAEDLTPKMEDVKAEEMGDLVDREMQETTNAIEQAAAKIAEMLAASRDSQTGIQLEVNESILDSCTDLMKAIMELVHKAKTLQKEIVSQGRGTSSAKDFYKKHHRWTEGLLSAAKAVGWGATVLLEGADAVVKGEGKFEELMVCSQEIAASTTQLVVASKVKANRDSDNLKALSVASKRVSEATGKVVASAKSGAQRIEDQDLMDFSKLTLHQAKRMEMDSQVRVLELESNLEKERVRLAGLRKQHYQLAGESEGWDQDEKS